MELKAREQAGGEVGGEREDQSERRHRERE